MNRIISAGLILISMAAFACGGSAKKGGETSKETSYGEKFDAARALTVDKALQLFKDSGRKDAVISGSISQVCQGEGCWYSIKHGEADQYVEFGEKFTIAKDCAGKNTIAGGYFYRDTTSVEQLKSEAKEEGKPAADIEAIKEPRISISFRALGLTIK